jgi:pyridoxal phosphate enzyme (YggS family)
MTIADQIQQVRLNMQKVEAELATQPTNSQGKLRLLAVSKTHPASRIQEAYESGITEFGESYLQEALNKIESCQNLTITWHFIGALQSNKTRLVAENFDWVQSVCKEKQLVRLNDQRPKNLKPLQVCIQVNLFNESQKNGATKDEVSNLFNLSSNLKQIKLRGIMAIPPKQTDFHKQLEQFNQITQLFRSLQTEYPSIDTLSIGMSGDMRAAILAGSNMIRVGTAIFGPRGKVNESS